MPVVCAYNSNTQRCELSLLFSCSGSPEPSDRIEVLDSHFSFVSFLPNFFNGIRETMMQTRSNIMINSNWLYFLNK